MSLSNAEHWLNREAHLAKHGDTSKEMSFAFPTDTTLVSTVNLIRNHREDVPRVHPNGFIQLDLTPRHRLHVWHPALPYRQRTYHPIHDHVFSFASTVYFGRLINVHHTPIWVDDPIPQSRTEELRLHRVWQAKCTGKEETVLEPAKERAVLSGIKAHIILPGGRYSFKALYFHETIATVPTLTVMEKAGPTAHDDNTLSPRILVPEGIEPDNDFQRDQVDVDLLWRLIEECFQ